eukprot:TRINITY_DN12303_c0_g1_i2.p3 TRINITY_DN12303_c0_g1~~TRINITY_DN12303_c0_g1_i2.p3  ORF type:complete len:165 (+),score=34.71 TRINITY_DN12303_c0_g1_i2:181-675(+)
MYQPNNNQFKIVQSKQADDQEDQECKQVKKITDKRNQKQTIEINNEETEQNLLTTESVQQEKILPQGQQSSQNQNKLFSELKNKQQLADKPKNLQRLFYLKTKNNKKQPKFKLKKKMKKLRVKTIKNQMKTNQKNQFKTKKKSLLHPDQKLDMLIISDLFLLLF